MKYNYQILHAFAPSRCPLLDCLVSEHAVGLSLAVENAVNQGGGYIVNQNRLVNARDTDLVCNREGAHRRQAREAIWRVDEARSHDDTSNLIVRCKGTFHRSFRAEVVFQPLWHERVAIFLPACFRGGYECEWNLSILFRRRAQLSCRVHRGNRGLPCHCIIRGSFVRLASRPARECVEIGCQQHAHAVNDRVERLSIFSSFGQDAPRRAWVCSIRRYARDVVR